MTDVTRRNFLRAGAAAGLAALTSEKTVSASGSARSTADSLQPPTTDRMITIDASPAPVSVDLSKVVLLIVDMQNDFGAEGRMLHRAGIDITGIRSVIAPIVKVRAAAQAAGIKSVYLKMGFRADLTDLGRADSPNRVRHLAFGVGKVVRAPNGSESRILVRDTWGTDVRPEVAPGPDDIVIYKTRYSGFYKTELDGVLQGLGATHLIVTGCTTSIYVESTVRDAMFHDYSAVVLADCVAEPYGRNFSRSNHEASLLIFEAMGWVSRSEAFITAVGTLRPADNPIAMPAE